METMNWKQVKYNSTYNDLLDKRWAHSSCLIYNELVVFGGFANSIFMNDLWTFHIQTMVWKKIETFGPKPMQCSNSTIHYDQSSKKLILFGGGGANKTRFNTIYILNWQTKHWNRLMNNLDTPGPCQRTYHSSQLFYPYLVVFGGQFIEDLADLWIFNLQKQSWQQIKLSANMQRPCARRFHTSIKKQSTFYILFGCYGKYKALGDIYSIDLSSYFETQLTSSLIWKKHQFDQKIDTRRWGHTSTVYNGKIYNFGGRNTSDYNDIIVFDIQNECVNTLVVKGEAPKARRKASSCFIGNSLLIFGGFNIEYFNDAYYLEVKQQASRAAVPSYHHKCIQQLYKIPELDRYCVYTKQGTQYTVIIGLLIDKFSSAYNLYNLLTDIQNRYSLSQLKALMNTISHGYGPIQQHLIYQYGINVFGSQEDMIMHYQTKFPKYYSKRHFFDRDPSQIIQLQEEEYSLYQNSKLNDQFYYDCQLIVNQDRIQANRPLLASKSLYFMYLLSSISSNIHITVGQPQLFQIILHYLNHDCIIIRQKMGYFFWFDLIKMAQYYCINGLINLCQQKILTFVTEDNCNEILQLSLEIDLDKVANKCSQIIVMSKFASLRQLQQYCLSNNLTLQKKAEKKMEKMRRAFEKLKFKMYQSIMKNNEKILPPLHLQDKQNLK